ncbi:MAG: CmcI family methyltransferase [Pseudanabaena sp. ELA607]
MPELTAPITTMSNVIAPTPMLRHDYIASGLSLVFPDPHFPNMISGDTDGCGWQYLRGDVPHHWYVDRRQPRVGFLSRDEAHILYNNALQFAGKRALEVGCWLGWSACHLALAGVKLDVIDPLLAKEDFRSSVTDSLTAAGVMERVNLIGGSSPQAVTDLANADGTPRRWSLIFIDGDHGGDAPLKDAIACAPFAADDAMILFHDLAAPEVAAGLDYLRQQGWQTMVYQTMQIMGVAWRGDVQPVAHVPDPQVNWQIPLHLQHFVISGMVDADLAEFQELAAMVQPYTVLSQQRLCALYRAIKRICLEDRPGHVVECGVFKGGASAMMAAVIQRYSQRPRRVYSFDTFTGMPDPIDVDRHQGIFANDTPFGAGTLQAPLTENLLKIADILGVSSMITPVAGLFAETLPQWRGQIGEIALLHADGDWYESTLDIFHYLYDLVTERGFIQIDDYGHWEGCRVAVHDFERVLGVHFDLQFIDYTGRQLEKEHHIIPHPDLWHTALPLETMFSLQDACLKYPYKGIPMLKNPFDMALYLLLLAQVRPATIIEIGSCAGGSAVWFADLLTMQGIDAHVYSVDINPVQQIQYPKVTFLGGDQNHLEQVFSAEFIANLPRPLLVIEDGAHLYETTYNVVQFFHPYLQKGEYIIVEDGIITDLGQDAIYNGGPCRALRQFLAEHPTEYVIDRQYCDFFGRNLTWNINGYLRKVRDVVPESVPALTSWQLIAFFDWSYLPEALYDAVQELVRALLQNPHTEQIHLMLYAKPAMAELADNILSEAVMALLLAADVTIATEPNLAIITDVDPLLGQPLPHIHWRRVIVDLEDTDTRENLAGHLTELALTELATLDCA